VTAGDGRLVAWARELQSLVQTGLHYTENAYDRQRYERIRDIAAEMLAGPADADAEGMKRILARETGPGTPKLVVRAMAFRDERILLVRETTDGRWAPPGGWVDVNERPSDAVAREVREESGFEVGVRRLIYLHDHEVHGTVHLPFHVYTAFFLCDLLGGEPTTSLETSEIGFFAEDDLPTLSRPRVTEAEIAAAFAALREPDRPARFD